MKVIRNGKVSPFFTSLHFAARLFYEVLTRAPHRSNNFSIYISLQTLALSLFCCLSPPPPPQN
jgi:hypothetical protein